MTVGGYVLRPIAVSLLMPDLLLVLGILLSIGLDMIVISAIG
jgi:hypothetical protein